MNIWAKRSGQFVYASRWALFPLSIGLLFVLIAYIVAFLVNDFHFLVHSFKFDAEYMAVLALTFVDAYMVANLMLMILQGTMPVVPTFADVKAVTPEEAGVLRRIFARHGVEHSECPCGFFYKGARCPDAKCKLWKKANGTRRWKLYAHADKETAYLIGRDKIGLEGKALDNFCGWGYELEFEVDIDVETGDTKLLTVDGHKIFPVKG